MKLRKSLMETPVIDQQYLSSVYQNIIEHINTLDKLNQSFKIKQEEHFLKTFMNVLQKMGNDLIIAQQAYRNIDIEVKRDQYCLSLAKELNFFKNQCFILRAELKKAQLSTTNFKIQKENIQYEIASLRENHEKKVKQCLKLSTQNTQLRKKMKKISINDRNTMHKTIPVKQGYLRDNSELKDYFEGRVTSKDFNLLKSYNVTCARQLDTTNKDTGSRSQRKQSLCQSEMNNKKEFISNHLQQKTSLRRRSLHQSAYDSYQENKQINK